MNGQQFSDFNFTAENGFGPGSYTLVDANQIMGDLGSVVTGTIAGFGASLSATDGNLVLMFVPEPSTLVLLGIGVIGLVVCRYRRSRARVRAAG